jgi:hypothetical protein
MRKTRTSEIVLLAALCCAFSTACSSGGGGGMSKSVATSGNTAPAAQVNTAPAPDSSDTGVAGTVAVPAAAAFGTAPAQLATAGGASFDGSSGSYPANVTFLLIATGLQKSSTGLSPTPADPAATATVVYDSSGFSHIELAIPSVGINNQTIYFDPNLTGVGDNGDTIFGLSYVATSGWAQTSLGTNNSSLLTNAGVYVFGFETPQAAMPTSGTAVFSGQGLAQGTVYKTVGTEIQSSNPISGNASISADFGSGAVNGSFTQMKVTNTTAASEEQWNDVSITANIATGSNRFNGTTAAASAPGTPMSLSGSAVGKINGAFFGPAAQNLGAIWSLSDGTGSALGTVLAGH